MASEALKQRLVTLMDTYSEAGIQEASENGVLEALKARSEVVFDALRQELDGLLIEGSFQMVDEASGDFRKRYIEKIGRKIQFLDEFLPLCDRCLNKVAQQGARRDQLIQSINEHRLLLPGWRARYEALLK